MPYSGICRCLVLVRTDISEERFSSIIREKRICELGTTLKERSNLSTLRRNAVFLRSVLQLLVTANVVPSSLILFTLMK
jgi:hypothetical protein